VDFAGADADLDLLLTWAEHDVTKKGPKILILAGNSANWEMAGSPNQTLLTLAEACGLGLVLAWQPSTQTTNQPNAPHSSSSLLEYLPRLRSHSPVRPLRYPWKRRHYELDGCFSCCFQSLFTIVHSGGNCLRKWRLRRRRVRLRWRIRTANIGAHQ
jgi:hypothetical protein